MLLDLEKEILENRIKRYDEQLAHIQKMRKEADQALKRLDMEREQEKRAHG